MEENGEDSHSLQSRYNMEDLKDSSAADEDVEPQATPTMETSVKSSGDNSRKRRKPDSKEAATPLLDRPSRERKSVERFIDSVEKEKEKPKEIKVEQGSGTCLRDIPNVVFKFSKRKWSDETVQFLHKLLYNRRAKPHQVKANILQFSGWVWGANEEKEKSKLKEKLEKCFKESLWQVSDVFDLNLPKTTKKEDMVLKVFEFLDCPYKTTEKLLEEQEQKAKEKKRLKTPGTGKKKTSGQIPSKKQRLEGESSNGRLEDEEEEDDDDDEQHLEVEPDEEPAEDLEEEEEPEVVEPKKRSSGKPKKLRSARKGGRRSAKKSSDTEDTEVAAEEVAEDMAVVAEESEEVDNDPEEEEELKQKQNKKKKTDNAVNSASPKRSGRKHSKTKSVNEPLAAEEEGDENKSKPPSSVSKTELFEEAKVPQGKKKSDTGSSKSGSRQRKKEKGVETPLEAQKKVRGKSQPESKEESKPIPLDDDLRITICDLLNEADFSTVTFTDVVKQLEAKFDVDLSQRKAHVRLLIQEEISKLVDDEEGEAEGDAEDVGVEEPDKKELEPMVAAPAKE